MYQQDGDFKKDIEINDYRNRYTITKGATQKQVRDIIAPRALIHFTHVANMVMYIRAGNTHYSHSFSRKIIR